MNRRQVLQIVGLTALTFSAFAVTEEERLKFLQVRRVGLVTRPLRIRARISRASNMYSQLGGDDAIARQIGTAFGSRLDEFTLAMKKQLNSTLQARGFSVSDVAFLANAGFFSRPYAADEPFYLDCECFYYFVLLNSEKIAPGAGVFAMLIPRSLGRYIYSRVVNFGFNPLPTSHRSTQLGMLSERFGNVSEIIASADNVSSALMPLSLPLGSAIGESFAREIETATETKEIPHS
jgi:hypothetical protein